MRRPRVQGWIKSYGLEDLFLAGSGLPQCLKHEAKVEVGGSVFGLNIDRLLVQRDGSLRVPGRFEDGEVVQGGDELRVAGQGPQVVIRRLGGLVLLLGDDAE